MIGFEMGFHYNSHRIQRQYLSKMNALLIGIHGECVDRRSQNGTEMLHNDFKIIIYLIGSEF